MLPTRIPDAQPRDLIRGESSTGFGPPKTERRTQAGVERVANHDGVDPGRGPRDRDPQGPKSFDVPPSAGICAPVRRLR